MHILRETSTFRNLPKDPRTFLKTPKMTLMHTVAPGLYHHIRILNSLNDIFKYHDTIPLVIKIAINIHGLPISNFSTSQLYPIFGMIKNYKPLNNIVFLIGI